MQPQVLAIHGVIAVTTAILHGYIQPAQQVCQRLTAFIHRAQVEHLRRDTHAEYLCRIDAALVDDLPAGRGHVPPYLSRILLRPLRLRIVNGVGLV
jgi:hypothetical protein